MPFATLEKFIQNDTSVNLHYLDRCNQNKNKIIKTNYKLILNEQIRPEIVDILHSVIEKYRYKTISPYSIDIDTTEVDCIHSIDAKEVPFLDVFIKQFSGEEVTYKIISDDYYITVEKCTCSSDFYVFCPFAFM